MAPKLQLHGIPMGSPHGPWSKWFPALRACDAWHRSARPPWPRGGCESVNLRGNNTRPVVNIINIRVKLVNIISIMSASLTLSINKHLCKLKHQYYSIQFTSAPEPVGFQILSACGEDSTARSAQKNRCPKATSFRTWPTGRAVDDVDDKSVAATTISTI